MVSSLIFGANVCDGALFHRSRHTFIRNLSAGLFSVVDSVVVFNFADSVIQNPGPRGSHLITTEIFLLQLRYNHNRLRHCLLHTLSSSHLTSCNKCGKSQNLTSHQKCARLESRCSNEKVKTETKKQNEVSTCFSLPANVKHF